MAFSDLHEGILEEFAERAMVRLLDDIDATQWFSVMTDRDRTMKEGMASYLAEVKANPILRARFNAKRAELARGQYARAKADPAKVEAHRARCRENMRASRAAKKARAA